MHAARQVRLDEGEAVRQRERELADRVRPGLGDVIARDRHRIEVLHVVVDEVFLDVPHHLQGKLGGENAGVLPLVFLQDVGLHRAAHGGERPRLDLGVFVLGRLTLVVGTELVHLLVDRGVEEHRQHGRRRAVDGHGHRSVRAAQIEPVVQHLDVVQSRDRHARVADLAVDVRALVRLEAVERDRVERGREALRRHAGRHVLEALVGAKGVALAREHARGIFILALEREHAGGVGEGAGHVLQQQPFEQLAVVFVARQRDLADGAARERLGGELGTQFAAADFDHVLVA